MAPKKNKLAQRKKDKLRKRAERQRRHEIFCNSDTPSTTNNSEDSSYSASSSRSCVDLCTYCKLKNASLAEGNQEVKVDVTDTLVPDEEGEVDVTDTPVPDEEGEVDVTDIPVPDEEGEVDVTDIKVPDEEGEVDVTDTPVPDEEGEVAVTDTPVPDEEGEVDVTDTPVPDEEGEVDVTDTPDPDEEGEVDVTDTPVPDEEGEVDVTDTPVPDKEGEVDVTNIPVPNDNIKMKCTCKKNTVGSSGYSGYRYDLYWMKVYQRRRRDELAAGIRTVKKRDRKKEIEHLKEVPEGARRSGREKKEVERYVAPMEEKKFRRASIKTKNQNLDLNRTCSSVSENIDGTSAVSQNLKKKFFCIKSNRLDQLKGKKIVCLKTKQVVDVKRSIHVSNVKDDIPVSKVKDVVPVSNLGLSVDEKMTTMKPTKTIYKLSCLDKNSPIIKNLEKKVAHVKGIVREQEEPTTMMIRVEPPKPTMRVVPAPNPDLTYPQCTVPSGTVSNRSLSYPRSKVKSRYMSNPSTPCTQSTVTSGTVSNPSTSCTQNTVTSGTVSKLRSKVASRYMSNLSTPGTQSTVTLGKQGPANRVTQALNPNIRLKILPFYEPMNEIMKPIQLVPKSNAEVQKTHVYFRLTAQQTMDIVNSVAMGTSGKLEYTILIQLRFCLLETRCEQEDNFPPDVCVQVNGKTVYLAPKTKQQGREPKVTYRPLNITPFCLLQSKDSNHIYLSWVADPYKKYCVALNLVKKLSTGVLIDQLQQYGYRHADDTRALIKEKLSQSMDPEIATTSLRVSLICPLSKRRMTVPVRASTCTHLQCFDALPYLMMNEKKPTWICPVCSKESQFHNLFVDGLFAEICQLTDSHEIQLAEDGSWQPMESTKDYGNAYDPVGDLISSSDEEDDSSMNVDIIPEEENAEEEMDCSVTIGRCFRSDFNCESDLNSPVECTDSSHLPIDVDSENSQEVVQPSHLPEKDQESSELEQSSHAAVDNIDLTEFDQASHSTVINIDSSDSEESPHTCINVDSIDSTEFEESSDVIVTSIDSPELEQSSHLSLDSQDSPELEQSSHVTVDSTDAPEIDQSSHSPINSIDSPELEQSSDLPLDNVESPGSEQPSLLSSNTRDRLSSHLKVLMQKTVATNSGTSQHS